MDTYKVWALTIDEVTDNDVLWLQGLGVEVKCEALTNRVYSAGFAVSQYVTGYKIDVTTTCDKQENMLKLKYGDDLVLKSEIKSISVPYENSNMASHRRSATR
jgi:hypothetical protein